MRALYFLVNTLFMLYAVLLLLRLLMQVTRADFRNPLGRAVLQLTNPVILPLRKVLMPIGRVDTASVVAVVLCVVLKFCVLSLLFGMPLLHVQPILRAAALDLIRLVLNTYLISIVLNALLSFVAPGNYSPVQSLLASICKPVLDPIRRVVPSIAGVDLSPLWACIAIQALLLLLP